MFLILMHFLILKYRDAHVPKQITFSKFKKKSKVRKKINKTQWKMCFKDLVQATMYKKFLCQLGVFGLPYEIGLRKGGKPSNRKGIIVP